MLFPEWVIWFLIVVNCICIVGWGHTINKSMRRCLDFYSKGYNDGLAAKKQNRKSK